MKNCYYILTTKAYMIHFGRKCDALAYYKEIEPYTQHIRLEIANDIEGTARVIKAKNNIW